MSFLIFINKFGVFLFLAQDVKFIYSRKGRPLLVYDNYLFRYSGDIVWRCSKSGGGSVKTQCKAYLRYRKDEEIILLGKHIHADDKLRIEQSKTFPDPPLNIQNKYSTFVKNNKQKPKNTVKKTPKKATLPKKEKKTNKGN